MPTIVNRTKQIQVFNLPLGKAGEDGSETIERKRVVEDKDGTRGVLVEKKRIAGSVTFLAGEKKEVSDFVARAPEVKRAIDRQVLRLL